MLSSKIPERLKNATVKKCIVTKDQGDQLNKWAEKANSFLLIHGEPGRGKTYMAVAILRMLNLTNIVLTDDQFFLEVPDFFQFWSYNEDDRYPSLSMLKYVKLLVVDDLGVRKSSDAFLEYMHALLNCRYNNNLGTIITTNLSSKEFNDFFGARVVSRATSGIRIELKGDDKRRLADV